MHNTAQQTAFPIILMNYEANKQSIISRQSFFHRMGAGSSLTASVAFCDYFKINLRMKIWH